LSLLVSLTWVPPTDLIAHRTRIKPGTPIYKAKQRRYSPYKEFWLRKYVVEGLESGLFERTTVANGERSRWGAGAVIVEKPGKFKPRLTFNYHWVFEETPGNQMELSERTHTFLASPSHRYFSKADLKNEMGAQGVQEDEGLEDPITLDDEWDVRLSHATSCVNPPSHGRDRLLPRGNSTGSDPGELLDLEDAYPSQVRCNILRLIEGDGEPLNEDEFTEAVHNFMAKRQNRTRIVHSANVQNQLMRKRGIR
jgi:hypothetical protein